MRINAYFAIAAVVLTFEGCNKKSDSFPTTLYGKWELAYTYGGWAGHQTFPRGNGNTYHFKQNTYVQSVHYGDNSFQVSGTYSIFKGHYCQQSNDQTLIQFGDNTQPFVFSFSGTTITIASPECIVDGASAVYRKIFP